MTSQSFLVLIFFCLVLIVTNEIYSNQKYLRSAAYNSELKSSNALATKLYMPFWNIDSINSSRINANFDNRSKSILANKNTGAVGSINSSLNSRDNFNITIIGQLGGEMGNHLSYILGMYTVSHRLKEKFNITSHIRFRHQDRRKWVNGYNSMQSCFPKFRGVDFSFFNSPNFKPLMDSQPISPMEDPDEIVRFALNHSSTFRLSNGTHPSSPFIYLKNAMVSSFEKDQIMRFRNLFQFDMDNPKCCNPQITPYANETVFHFRNFKREMPRRYKSLGFAEMDANETFIELFSDAKIGDNVAIITRFDNDEETKNIANVLKSNGLRVRIISGQSGEQDFCFLLKSKKNIVGSTKSTFFVWAGLLGNSSLVHSYAIGNQIQGPNMTGFMNKTFVTTRHGIDKKL